MEEVPEYFTPSVSEIESHYLANVSRTVDSMYIVKLPIVNSMDKFGNSKRAALMRLFAMERQFVQNSNLKNEYVKFMDKFLQLGHMESVPKHEIHMPDGLLSSTSCRSET